MCCKPDLVVGGGLIYVFDPCFSRSVRPCLLRAIIRCRRACLVEACRVGSFFGRTQPPLFFSFIRWSLNSFQEA